jgi:hypothetical protein
MVRGKDKWQDLPDVVAQLQAEAANPIISRPRIEWPDEPSRGDHARPPVQAHREYDPRLPAPGNAAGPPPVPPRRDSAIARAPSTESPANARIEWGGLGDYDGLAADPRPDLRALGQLLVDACQRSCGARYKAIERLVTDANRRIDKLLAETDAASWRTQREALGKLLDRIEDLLASALTVKP